MGGDTETRQMTPYFSSTFSALTVCNIHFCICLDHSGLQNTAILGKSYRFGQSFILFQKIDTLRLLKIHIIFCPPSVAKKSISSRTMVEHKDLYERSDTNFEHVFSICISIEYFAFDLHVIFTPKHEIFILAATTSERNTKPYVSGSE